MIKKMGTVRSRLDNTGLYKRRFLNEFLHKEIESCKRYKRDITISIADINNFKDINDTYGHLAGDTALKAIADIMLKSVRNADIVSCYGDEEFIIVMPETTKDNAAAVVERIREKISQEKIALPDNKAVTLTISIGMASYPDDADTTEDLLITADEMLYRAKREGKNRVVCLYEAA